MAEARSAFKILTGKPTGKRPLGKPRPNNFFFSSSLNSSVTSYLQTNFLLYKENGEWRRLHNEELHVARMEEGRNAFKILTGKPAGKRPLGRPRRKWEDNIRINPK
jgi:hypothetical protein